MDTLAGFLDGPRANGAFLLRSLMTPPWSLSIEDEAPLTLVAIVRGHACIVTGRPDHAEPVRLSEGDVAIVRGPAPYTVADEPTTATTVRILPGQQCVTPDGHSLTDAMSLGGRTWGNSPVGTTAMLTGTYNSDGEVSRRLLSALPDLIVLRHDQWQSPLVSLLADEIDADTAGQTVVLDRLLDLLLISALRAWFTAAGTQAPAWYRAHTDPVVGQAIGMLHAEPARQWTVAELARQTGVSRAALARRFNEIVGEPPMHYLAGWRLALAADHLRQPEATVASVARTVGYTSPFTFSAAFKRTYGTSPSQHRAALSA